MFDQQQQQNLVQTTLTSHSFLAIFLFLIFLLLNKNWYRKKKCSKAKDRTKEVSNEACLLQKKTLSHYGTQVCIQSHGHTQTLQKNWCKSSTNCMCLLPLLISCCSREKKTNNIYNKKKTEITMKITEKAQLQHNKNKIQNI